MIFDRNFRTAPNPVPSIANLNESVVIISMDTEETHERRKPGKPKYSSYGFTVLEMSKAANIAPGPAGKNWHQRFDDYGFFRYGYQDKHNVKYDDFGGVSYLTIRV